MKRIILFLLVVLCTTPVLADEWIRSFHSEIEVFADGSMQVTEAITVQAEGQDIKRGIYRDFPTDYRDRFGNRYVVDFAVLDVRRDGVVEPYHLKSQGNGVRVYVGSSNVFLDPGEYRYELTYRTNRQLGFFDDHDELYWNVTGNDWIFPIDTASAVVTLPEVFAEAEVGTEAYTGPRGAKGSDYRVERGLYGEPRFETTRPLARGEGLTIVVTWPKGFVTEPGPEEKAGYLLRDNQSWVVAGAGLAMVLVYFLIAWFRVGRDPEAGVVIAQYSPPTGFSPASTRFVEKMGYDHKTFAAAVINLAVQGLVEIIDDNNEYVLKRTKAAATELAPGEKVLLTTLFGSVNNSEGKRQALNQKFHAKIGRSLKAHEESLRNDYEKRFFATNKWWLVPGLLLSLLTLGGTLLTLDDAERMGASGFMLVWLAGWSAGVVVLLYRVVNAWRGAVSAMAIPGALFITLFSLPFLIAEIVVIGLLAKATPALPAVLVAALVINLLFYQLLKAPTRAGRRLLDKIEGFRLFLEVAEKEEMNFKNPPEKTPELFERFLPYALALDVEHRWAERFASLFSNLQGSGDSYRPSWYHGSNWSVHHPTMFSAALGSSLSSALAASSTAPGSSSGSGGGGSSGGGGGGGGGGGW